MQTDDNAGNDVEDTKSIYGSHGEKFVERERANKDRMMLSETILSMLGDVSGKRVLDAGCGVSREMMLMADAGAHVVGVDITPNMIEIAKKEFAGMDIDLSVGDMKHTHLDADSFDAVVSAFSVPYTKDLAGVVREFGRVMKPGGVFVLAVVHPVRKMVKYSDGDYFDTGKRWEEWENGIKIFNYYRTIEEYVNTLVENGFSIKEIREPKPSAEKYPYYLVIRAELLST